MDTFIGGGGGGGGGNCQNCCDSLLKRSLLKRERICKFFPFRVDPIFFRRGSACRNGLSMTLIVLTGQLNSNKPNLYVGMQAESYRSFLPC